MLNFVIAGTPIAGSRTFGILRRNDGVILNMQLRPNYPLQELQEFQTS